MDEQETQLWKRVVETAQMWEFWRKRHEDEGPSVRWLAPSSPPSAWTESIESALEIVEIMEEEQTALKTHLEALKEWTHYCAKHYSSDRGRNSTL